MGPEPDSGRLSSRSAGMDRRIDKCCTATKHYTLVRPLPGLHDQEHVIYALQPGFGRFHIIRSPTCTVQCTQSSLESIVLKCEVLRYFDWYKFSSVVKILKTSGVRAHCAGGAPGTRVPAARGHGRRDCAVVRADASRDSPPPGVLGAAGAWRGASGVGGPSHGSRCAAHDQRRRVARAGRRGPVHSPCGLLRMGRGWGEDCGAGGGGRAAPARARRRAGRPAASPPERPLRRGPGAGPAGSAGAAAAGQDASPRRRRTARGVRQALPACAPSPRTSPA